jgi:hypothetical protein
MEVSSLIVLLLHATPALLSEFNWAIENTDIRRKFVLLVPPVDQIQFVNRWFDFLQDIRASELLPRLGAEQLQRVLAFLFRPDGTVQCILSDGRSERDYGALFRVLVRASASV